jgi:hypothetical protein
MNESEHHLQFCCKNKPTCAYQTNGSEQDFIQNASLLLMDPTTMWYTRQLKFRQNGQDHLQNYTVCTHLLN